MYKNFWLYLRNTTDELKNEPEELGDAGKQVFKDPDKCRPYPNIYGWKPPRPRRKLFWTLEISDVDGEVIKPHFVGMSARPKLTIEETEINFLSNKTWITDSITTTHHVQDDETSQQLYDLVVRNPSELTATLKLHDGVGSIIETWTLENTIIQTINFGGLDYTGTGEVELECTWLYSEAKIGES